MSAEIIFSKSAEKQLLKLNKNIAERLMQKLLEFGSDIPPTSRAKGLTNSKDAEYRYRVGDFRILFDYNEKLNQIEILKVAHRRDVYE
jgi:mRNA interferase RelE/StbE